MSCAALERGRLLCAREELERYLRRMAELGIGPAEAVALLKEEGR